MFYIKTEIAEGVTLRSEITNKNTFCICPKCGKENHVDLEYLSMELGGEMELYGESAIWCEECIEKTDAARIESMSAPQDAEYFGHMADAMEALIEVWKIDGVSPKERYLRFQRAFQEILPELPPEAFPDEEC